MGGTDKLFADLNGRPVLAHSTIAFIRCPAIEEIVVVVHPDSLARARDVLQGPGWNKVRHIVAGGERRQDSVRNGLLALAPCDLVAIHDGARPLVSRDIIETGLQLAAMHGGAVAAVPVKDTVKRVDAGGFVCETLDRATLRAVQTPQCFRYSEILDAYQTASSEYTDDAMLFEHAQRRVVLYPGADANLKITTPEDLLFATALMNRRDA